LQLSDKFSQQKVPETCRFRQISEEKSLTAAGSRSCVFLTQMIDSPPEVGDDKQSASLSTRLHAGMEFPASNVEGLILTLGAKSAASGQCAREY
jgi:hypothetical protein